MTKEELYKIILDIDSNWEVKDIVVNEELEEVTIEIAYIKDKGLDPESGELCRIYDHRKERRWRHLDTMQYKTFISCSVPRVQNSEGKINTIRVPWADKLERFTYLMEKKVIDLLQATKNQTKTGQLVRMSFDQINRIMHRATTRGMKRRQGMNDIQHISIDEKSFKRGHDYVTVLSSPQTGSILDVSHGRKKESVVKVIDATFNESQQANILTVTMDMWEAYITTVKDKLPKSATCHDKFHLVKYLNDAVDKVRRKEAKTQEELRNTRYIWLKDKLNLTEKQRITFEAINMTNYQTAKAWRIKENFRDITFDQPMMAGFYIYNKWSYDARNSYLDPIIKVAEMFDRHRVGIVNAITLGKNNSMAERLNGKIQEIKISGRGYRTFKNFRSAILFFHGKLNLYPQQTQ